MYLHNAHQGLINTKRVYLTNLLQEISQIQWLTSSLLLEHHLQHQCTIYCHNFSTNVTKNWSLCISRRGLSNPSIKEGILSTIGCQSMKRACIFSCLQKNYFQIQHVYIFIKYSVTFNLILIVHLSSLIYETSELPYISPKKSNLRPFPGKGD